MQDIEAFIPSCFQLEKIQFTPINYSQSLDNPHYNLVQFTP